MTDNLVTVRVWGDFACFTRPEMKVERVSYPVMTPSAGAWHPRSDLLGAADVLPD